MKNLFKLYKFEITFSNYVEFEDYKVQNDFMIEIESKKKTILVNAQSMKQANKKVLSWLESINIDDTQSIDISLKDILTSKQSQVIFVSHKKNQYRNPRGNIKS